jgi:hypothetical protein
MTENHIIKLTKIDIRLQLINEERLTLLNERQAFITQYEAELAQNFNRDFIYQAQFHMFYTCC